MDLHALHITVWLVDVTVSTQALGVADDTDLMWMHPNTPAEVGLAAPVGKLLTRLAKRLMIENCCVADRHVRKARSEAYALNAPLILDRWAKRSWPACPRRPGNFG